MRPARCVRAAAVAGALSLLLAPLAARAQHPLVTLPLGDPAYVQLEGLERLGCAAARVSAHRPFFVRDVRAAVAAAAIGPSCAGPLLTLLRGRFAPDTAAMRSAMRDTLADVAPDLAAAAAAAAMQDEEPHEGGIGGALTVRLTSLTRGEFRPLWTDVRPVSEGTPPAVAIARLRGTATGGRRLVAVAEAYGEGPGRNDPTIRNRRLRRTTGVVDFSEAYVNARVGPLVVSLGRSREAWLGEEDESLVLSANGPAMDRLLLAARWRKFEARALAGVLDDVLLTPATDSFAADVPDQLVSRAVFGHSLTWRPGPRFAVTLGETMLATGRQPYFNLDYANPAALLIVTQNDSGRTLAGRRDNLVVFGGVRARLGPVLTVAELAIDELQIDGADRKTEPDQLAWRLAATVPLPLLWPTSVTASYRRVDSYTYLRQLFSVVYQQYDRPLGSELGPDADMASAEAEVFPSGMVRLTGGVAFWRRGALRIDQRPAQRASGNAGRPFPSTTLDRPAVQRSVLVHAGLQRLSTVLPLSARVEAANISDANNQSRSAALYVRAQLVATYAFRYP